LGTSAQFDARIIAAHALDREQAWMIAHATDPIDAAARDALLALARRRAEGEPIAYVVGEAWFFGRAFTVTPEVLVPRPETEQLVEAALGELQARRHGKRQLRACDVGTGSGAIAVTLAAEDQDLDVVASDVSAAALALAAHNATRAGVAGRVRLVEGDLATPLVPLGPFDLVAANLPYGPSGDVPAKPDPVAFAPRGAVDGGADGLVLYRRLIGALPALLAPGGCALFEAAPPTIDALATLAAAALPDAHVEIGEDYAGLERWICVALR
jgi:release factor glutamine methyltransferase